MQAVDRELGTLQMTATGDFSGKRADFRIAHTARMSRANFERMLPGIRCSCPTDFARCALAR